MNIHLITGGNVYSSNYIRFVKENFNESDNLFFVYKASENVDLYFTSYQNIKYYRRILPFIIQNYFKILKADKIIVHQLNIPLIMSFWLLCYPFVFKKLMWVIWGSDLYDYYAAYSGIKAKMIELVRRVFIKRIRYISSYIYGDYLLCKELYKTNAKYFKSWYPYTINKKVLDCSEKIYNLNNTLKIMVGNSADPSNRHIDALNKLLPFKDENIQIYLFLSYGGTLEYINQLKKEAYALFENKVVFVTDYMNFDKYIEIVNDMDICIFNHNRQQGLGNIDLLLCLKKKIFIRSTTTPFDHYSRMGVQLFDTDTINTLDFEKLRDVSYEKLVQNKDYLLQEISIDNIHKGWDKILNGSW
jgi:dTDP-N-acetylfucosamine:lipid II N-acetylfucosaminyltransferase